MKTKINIDEYVSLGGKLENLNLSKTFTLYSDRYSNKPVVSITEGYRTKPTPFTGKQSQLYNVKFENGESRQYAGMWIETEVDFIIHPKYL